MGKLALFCLAISTLCTLLTAEDIQVDQKFNPKKISGKWYPILTGSHHHPPPENVFALRAKPLSNGSFAAKVEMPVKGTCQVLNFYFKPTRPGFFKSEDGKAIVHIVETDYANYLISVFKMDDIYMMQLFAKKPKASSKWKKKFKKFAEKFRFNAGKVHDFSHAALCAPRRRRTHKVEPENLGDHVGEL